MADCTWVRYELDCVRGMVSELSTSEPCWSSTELPSKPVVGFHAQYAERDMEEADTVGRQEAVSPLLGHQSPTTRTVSPLSATHESPTIDEIAGQEASPHTWPYPTVVGGPMTPSQLGLKDRPKASAPLTISTHSHEPSPGGDSIVHACFRRGAALSRVSKWYSTAAGNIESRSLTAKTQIEDLRALVLVVNNEWTQRMTSDLELTPRCSTLPPRTLLEIGVKALKRYFRGTLPDTFVDVFALMHVACAFAYMLHKDDESYCCDCWEEFFQDMLQWQYAIAEESEVQIFLKAMDRLGSPETPSSALFGECRLSNHLPRQIAHKQAPNPRPKLDISCKLDPFLPQPGSEPFQQPSVAPNRAELWNRLKSGKVIKDCSTFLDGLEWADMAKNNELLLDLHFAWYARNEQGLIKDIVTNITMPLRMSRGIEALHDHVVDTEFQLRSGLLRSAREVEVALILGGRWCSKSYRVFERYQETVTFLCGKSMQDPDLVLRDRYHATMLESLEIDNRQALENPSAIHWSNTSVLAVVRPKRPAGNHEKSSVSSNCGSSINSSPTTVGSGSSKGLSMYESCSSANPSPIATCQSFSSSPTSPTSPGEDTGITRCPLCSQIFRGTLQNRKSNLRRHKRTALVHSDSSGGPICPEQDCGLRISRSDNLTKHLQTQHGVCSSPLEESPTKRRKGHIIDCLR
ncbi:hypothetical protein MMC28_006547 [Mycoblastus sanguinarius]|nr:hypothetical protein [Mycoblastus sanguinarius]